MTTQDFLFEIGTEELPPKVLKNMAIALMTSVERQLSELLIGFNRIQWLASPRRMAIIIDGLQTHQADQKVEKLGPYVEKAFDRNGQPTPAAMGFARSCEVDFNQLQRISDAKGERLYFTAVAQGKQTINLLENIFVQALKKLPIPKMMRWGDSDVEFVRPVHWILMLMGNQVVKANILGKMASNMTYGHRYHAPQAIKINHAKDYIQTLADQGKVMPDWEQRRALLIAQAQQLAEAHHAKVILDEDLIEEVCAIVEYPNALCCNFSKDFLRVPQEALISSMQEHQKCFPMTDAKGKLIEKFITISNIHSSKPDTVILGNQKVMTARLSDAAFFFDTDRQKSLESYLQPLQQVTFQKELGSMGDKVDRIASVSEKIAQALALNHVDAHRAGLLAKADLMTNMVFEFTDLQGIMGKYYAQLSGENDIVATAIEEHYWPLGSGAQLPNSMIGACVALADKLDTLVGIFMIGKKPTGDKDPFGLRRAAIGILRILKEKQVDIALDTLIDFSIESYQREADSELKTSLIAFFQDRLKVLYKDDGVNTQVFDAVVETQYQNIHDFDLRVNAVMAFMQSSSADALTQANKRVSNILRKNVTDIEMHIRPELLTDQAEIKLVEAINAIEPSVREVVKVADYVKALTLLSQLEQPIDAFFNDVMVMCDDIAQRHNRLAILDKLYHLFTMTADISKL